MPSDIAPSPLTGILLLAHGGPNSLEDIEPFLMNIRSGRPFPPHLLEEIRDRYRQIGGYSPLLELSRRQAQAQEQGCARHVGHGGRRALAERVHAVEELQSPGKGAVTLAMLAFGGLTTKDVCMKLRRARSACLQSRAST